MSYNQEMIEDYKFGEIKINGKTYRSDVIVYPDRVDATWWRKQGHNLELDDIKVVITEKPEVIVIGTGEPGLMKVEKKTIEYLENLNIETVVLPTKKACEEYNRRAKNEKIIACFHLTC